MSVVAGPEIVTNGLVLCLDASNPKSYSGTGTAWYDVSGKGYTATLFNSPAFSDGTIQFRSAATTSGYATTSFNEGVLKNTNRTGQFTIETIYRYVSLPSSVEGVIAGRSGCHGGIYLWNDNSVYVAVKTDQCWTGAVNYSVSSQVANTFYYVTMTYNNGTVKSYLNGNFTAQASLNLSAYQMFGYDDTFYIGGIPSGNPQFYATNTDIAVVRCYSTELTSGQVLQNFNAIRGRYGI
jgi:hypothetical protein